MSNVHAGSAVALSNDSLAPDHLSLRTAAGPSLQRPHYYQAPTNPAPSPFPSTASSHTCPSAQTTPDLGRMPPSASPPLAANGSQASASPSIDPNTYPSMARSGMTPEHFQHNYRTTPTVAYPPLPEGKPWPPRPDLDAPSRVHGEAAATANNGPMPRRSSWQPSLRSGISEPHPAGPSQLSQSHAYLPTAYPPLTALTQNQTPTSPRHPESSGHSPVVPTEPLSLADRGRSNSLLQLHQQNRQWELELQRLRDERHQQWRESVRQRRESEIRLFTQRRLPFRPLQRLTSSLVQTYKQCNPEFRYELKRNPRRALTKPSDGKYNDGYDNENSDYILYVNDVIIGDGGKKYLIQEPLGSGTFGQVVKCCDLTTNATVAVKVVKNKQAYYKQSLLEVHILRQLNQHYDPDDKRHILRLKDSFVFRKHMCLVFECLSLNLYEVIRQNKFQGLSANLVRVLASQILDCLVVLSEARVIHCDLKPENILLKSIDSASIKVIDFGSACPEQSTGHTYIQSRFYRSPEVLLGLPHTCAIDMWSLGCIVAELFIGLPLFPGSSEYNQLSRIVDMLGCPPVAMLEAGMQAGHYFERCFDTPRERRYRLKSIEQYSRETNREERPSKRYVRGRSLDEVIHLYPMSKRMRSHAALDQERTQRNCLIDFIKGLLTLNPAARWTPQQARLHPFITGKPFTAPFVPPPALAVSAPQGPVLSGTFPRHRSVTGYMYGLDPASATAYRALPAFQREARHSIAHPAGGAGLGAQAAATQVSRTRASRPRAATLTDGTSGRPAPPARPSEIAHQTGPTQMGTLAVGSHPSLHHGGYPSDAPVVPFPTLQDPSTAPLHGQGHNAPSQAPGETSGLSGTHPSDYSTNHQLLYYSIQNGPLTNLATIPAVNPAATGSGLLPSDPATYYSTVPMADRSATFPRHVTGQTMASNAASKPPTHHDVSHSPNASTATRGSPYHPPLHQRRRSFRQSQRQGQYYTSHRPSLSNISRLTDEFGRRTRINDTAPGDPAPSATDAQPGGASTSIGSHPPSATHAPQLPLASHDMGTQPPGYGQPNPSHANALTSAAAYQAFHQSVPQLPLHLQDAPTTAVPATYYALNHSTLALPTSTGLYPHQPPGQFGMVSAGPPQATAYQYSQSLAPSAQGLAHRLSLHPEHTAHHYGPTYPSGKRQGTRSFDASTMLGNATHGVGSTGPLGAMQQSPYTLPPANSQTVASKATSAMSMSRDPSGGVPSNESSMMLSPTEHLSPFAASSMATATPPVSHLPMDQQTVPQTAEVSSLSHSFAHLPARGRSPVPIEQQAHFYGTWGRRRPPG
ncbi:dual specificity protein kinase yak1 [Dimargaris verticillata]|uniref:Dual specificity protein kinase yak1 n=1 Tax=Dimargaris verticillata TaxID=2761393 RepID=A0A9W8B3T8_9FUNG|nr:dual specificity protein kinase yak1 [Dimargaris verticillata]